MKTLYLVFGALVFGLLWGGDVRAEGGKSQSDPPPASRTEKPPAPKKVEKKPSLWQRFKDGVAWLIPESIKKGWRKTKKKFDQTMTVYRAVRDLVLGDKKSRRQAARVHRKYAVKKKWKRADKMAERLALRELQPLLWRKSCRAGSARACQRWARRQPKVDEPLLFLRDILRRRKRWKPLMLVCRVLRKRKPDVLENQLCVADAMQAMGKKKSALKLYQSLSLRFSDSGAVWLDWGRLLLKLKRWQEAQTICRRATERMPRDSAAWRCLGRALSHDKKNQGKQARIAYEKACSLGDNKACYGVLNVLPKSRLRRWWAWSRIRSKLVGRAMARGTVWGSCSLGMGVACRKMARDCMNKARKLQSYGRYSEALWWLRQATRLSPKQASVWRALGLLMMRNRPSEAACQALHRSLQLQSKQYSLWLKLGSCYQLTARRDLRQARDAYLQACQPNTPGVGKPEACRKACSLGVKGACYHHLLER